MFKLSLSDVDLLKNSIPIIAEIIDEGVFKVDQNGISLVSPDRTMVSVVEFRLLSSAFDDFKVDSPASLGLNLANLSAVLKRAKSNDKILLESSGKNKLKISIKGRGSRVFEVPLLDVSTEKPPIEQLNFTASAEMESGILEEGIADAEVIGDSVVLEAGPGTLKIRSKGDVSSAELEIKKGDQGLLNLKSSGSVKAQYPLEYLKKMIKAGKLSSQLLLEFGTDYPIRLSFKSIDKMNLSFILAPRVSEE